MAYSQNFPSLPTSKRSQRAQLAQIRHDLRSPLNAILGYSDMLLEDGDGLDPAVGAQLQQIHDQGTELLQQITQTLQPQAASLPRVSQLMVTLHNSLSAILSTCTTLQTALPPTEAALRSDIDKIRIAAHALQQAFPRLLNQYQQHQSPTKLAPETMSRPLLQAAEQTLNRLNHPGSQVSSARILVVDDSDLNRDLLTRQLQRQGHQVMIAPDGQAALQQLEQDPVDLVLLDILMPEMNGYQVLMHLRQWDTRRRPSVIMMSSLDEIDNVVQCIELGAEDYVSKPINPILLNSKINACLERDRLRQQEVLFLAQSLIAEATPVSVLVTRLADGRILYANPMASDSFGVAISDLLNCCIQDFYCQDQDREQLAHQLQVQGCISGYDLPCRRSDGQPFWVTLSLQTLTFHGEAAALIALCDITDRKQAEERLRLAEMKYRGIFEHAAEGIYQAAPDGRFLNVNQAMAALYGYDHPDQMLAALVTEPNAPYLDTNCRELINRAVHTQDRVQGIEYQIRAADGALRWIHESVQAVRDSSGQYLYYEGIAEDITLRKQEEADLKRQLVELQIEIDQAKRERQVTEITQSDFFQELQTELATLGIEPNDF